MSDEEVPNKNTRATLVVPKFNEHSDEFYDFEHNIDDYSDITALTEATNEARYALFRITNEINKTDREYAEAKAKWSRYYRRALLVSEAKTSTERKIYAEMRCEKLETPMLIAEQYREEITRMANAIRLELQTLQSMGHNLRQQLRH